MSDWKQNCFSDECCFKMRSDGRIWVWRTAENVLTSNLPLFFQCLSNDRRSMHFSRAITPNGTLPLIKAGDHCKARHYVNNLKQARVQNWSSLALKLDTTIVLLNDLKLLINGNGAMEFAEYHIQRTVLISNQSQTWGPF